MMKWVALFLPLARAVPTPHGDRPAACILEIPDGATFYESGNGLTIEHVNGTKEWMAAHPSCHTDEVALRLGGQRRDASLGAKSNSIVKVGQWMDNAGYTYNAGYQKFNGNYNIPADPVDGNGQILYYFIGLENTNDGPVNILQPVLGWQEGWTLASWACCPGNISTTSRTISGLRAGQLVKGNMERTGPSTWRIDSSVDGQTTTLTPRVGSYEYVWADVTLEIYSISNCQQFSSGTVHFTDMKLTGSNGVSVTPMWTQPASTQCQGTTRIKDAASIDISHNGGSSRSILV